jgi:hypothetical protein
MQFDIGLLFVVRSNMWDLVNFSPLSYTSHIQLLSYTSHIQLLSSSDLNQYVIDLTQVAIEMLFPLLPLAISVPFRLELAYTKPDLPLHLAACFCWFLVRLTILTWRWKWSVPLKRQILFKLQSITHGLHSHHNQNLKFNIINVAELIQYHNLYHASLIISLYRTWTRAGQAAIRHWCLSDGRLFLTAETWVNTVCI